LTAQIIHQIYKEILMAKKSNRTSKKIKRTSQRLSKKTGIPAGVIYFFLILLLILVVLASEYLGFTTLTRTYFPDIYEMVFPATPTALVSPTAVTVPTEEGLTNGAGDWWELYFTEPTVINDPETQVSQIQERLIDLIDDSVSTVDIAVFEFNLVPIMDAVIAAEERGVEVRWVTDDEYGIEEDELEGHDYFKTLEKAGVEVIDDDRSGLMHNKYIIFDGAIVWTGSTNLTINGMYKNNNNSIVIYSEMLAGIFQTDFEEMWAGDFGARSESTVDAQSVNIAGSEITALFSPEDDAADYLAEFVSQASDSIYFMAFSFTNEAIGNAMMDVYDSGVTVSGIFETRASETEYSELTAFYCLGMPVRQDGNPATFHHKVIIVDQRWVVTGSFNFSDNADESNNENLIIIDNPEMAKLFLQEFERRWDEAEAPEPGDLSCP
jgi:phosphatidylserine/phosphatidylglycerophosphate/cardiolipin synthase-like enzyme